MYIPAHFREDDLEQLHALMKAYSFATLITYQDEGLFATHLPLLLDAERGPYGTLRAHVARANPQWRHFGDGPEALALFQGPHAFVSPSWYETQPSVPTWNYAVVHAYGTPRLLDDAGLYAVLRDSLAEFDPNLLTHGEPALPPDYLEKMMKAVVGFEIEITRLEGKYKLSQNRSQTDQERVIATLQQTGDPLSSEVAALMHENLTKRRKPCSTP